MATGPAVGWTAPRASVFQRERWVHFGLPLLSAVLEGFRKIPWAWLSFRVPAEALESSGRLQED